MISEDFVARACLRWFQRNHWRVVLYHPPGGQARRHFVFATGERFCPDITAILGDTVAVVECKPRKSVHDLNKLRRIGLDTNVYSQLSSFTHVAVPKLRTFHGFYSRRIPAPEPAIDLLVVRGDDFISHIEAADPS